MWKARTSRYLVFTSVGDLSNVNLWVKKEPLRLFDLAAVYYGKLCVGGDKNNHDSCSHHE